MDFSLCVVRTLPAVQVHDEGVNGTPGSVRTKHRLQTKSVPQFVE